MSPRGFRLSRDRRHDLSTAILLQVAFKSFRHQGPESHEMAHRKDRGLESGGHDVSAFSLSFIVHIVGEGQHWEDPRWGNDLSVMEVADQLT